MYIKTAYSYTSSDSQYWIFSDRRELDHDVIYASGFDFGHTGMFIEPYTGLYHTHYRDYDWRTHRWDREDPAGYVDGLNLYAAYFDVNGVDELGLFNKEYIEQMRKMGRVGQKSRWNYINPLDRHNALVAMLGSVWYGATHTSEGVQSGMENFREKTLVNADLPSGVKSTLSAASYVSEGIGVGSAYSSAVLTSIPAAIGLKEAAPHVGRYYLNAYKEYGRVALANGAINTGVGIFTDIYKDDIDNNLLLERAVLRFGTSYVATLTIGGIWDKYKFFNRASPKLASPGLKITWLDRFQGGVFNSVSGLSNDLVINNLYGGDLDMVKQGIYFGAGGLATPFGKSYGLYGGGLSEFYRSKTPFLTESIAGGLTELSDFFYRNYKNKDE